MRVRVRKWDYPRDVNAGLEKDKNWYEFQLVEDKEIEMSQDEFAQLVADEAERNHYLFQTENGFLLDAGDTTYEFYKDEMNS